MSTMNKTVLFILLSSFNVCQGMDTTPTDTGPSLTAVLPKEMLAEVVLALVSISTDFSEVAYSVNALSRTCTTMHSVINDHITTQSLISRCAQQTTFIPSGLLALIRSRSLVDSLGGAGAATDGPAIQAEGLMNRTQTISLYTTAVLTTPAAAQWLQQQITHPEQKRRAEYCLRYLIRANLAVQTAASRAAFTSLIKTGSHLSTNMSIDYETQQISPFGCAARSKMNRQALEIFIRPEFIPSHNDATAMVTLFQQPNLILTQPHLDAMLGFIQGGIAPTPRGRNAARAMLSQEDFVHSKRAQLLALKDEPTTDSFMRFQIRDALGGFSEPRFYAGQEDES